MELSDFFLNLRASESVGSGTSSNGNNAKHEREASRDIFVDKLTRQFAEHGLNSKTPSWALTCFLFGTIVGAISSSDSPPIKDRRVLATFVRSVHHWVEVAFIEKTSTTATTSAAANGYRLKVFVFTYDHFIQLRTVQRGFDLASLESLRLALDADDAFRPFSDAFNWDRSINNMWIRYVRISTNVGDQERPSPLNVRLTLKRVIESTDSGLKTFGPVMPILTRDTAFLDSTHFDTKISGPRDSHRIEKYPEFLLLAAEYFNRHHELLTDVWATTASTLYFVLGATVRFQGVYPLQVAIRYDVASATAVPTDLTLLLRNKEGQLGAGGMPTILVMTDADVEIKVKFINPQCMPPRAVQTESELYLLLKVALDAGDGRQILGNYALMRKVPRSLFNVLSLTDMPDQTKASYLLDEMAKLEHSRTKWQANLDGRGRFGRVDLVQHMVGQLLGAAGTTTETSDNDHYRGKFLFEYANSQIDAQVTTLVYVNGPSAVALNVAGKSLRENNHDEQNAVNLPHLEDIGTECNLKRHLMPMGVQQLIVFNVDFRLEDAAQNGAAFLQHDNDFLPWVEYHQLYASSSADYPTGLPCLVTSMTGTALIPHIQEEARYTGTLVTLGNHVPLLTTMLDALPRTHDTIIRDLMSIMEKIRMPVTEAMQAENIFNSFVSTRFRTVYPVDAPYNNVLGVILDSTSDDDRSSSSAEHQKQCMWHVMEWNLRRESEIEASSRNDDGSSNLLQKDIAEKYKGHVEKYKFLAGSTTMLRVSTVHVSPRDDTTEKHVSSCSDSSK